MITVSSVTKSFGTRILFEDVTVKFSPGRRYGLTGPNGAGKSTFMKMLTGEVEPSNRGTITRPRKVGVLRQDQFAFDDVPILDTVMMGHEILWAAFRERDELCAKENPTAEELDRLGELENVIGDENGYVAELDAADLLRGVGIPDERHGDLMRTLPTDLKFRVLLAQALFGEPEALLLDEPTNHMDLDSIHWLEGFLQDYKGTMVVVSHDRHFLNAVCTDIADIDYETIIVYPGDYDDMVRQKVQSRQQIEASNRDKAKKIAQLQEFVARFGSGQRASQAQSRRKEILRLKPEELKRSNIQRPFIRFEQQKPAGRDVVATADLTQAFDEKPLFQDLTLDVQRGDRMAIIGPNGAGKTTLLRTLIGELAPQSGSVRWGPSVDWGYYPQDNRIEAQAGQTVFEWLSQFDLKDDRTVVRGVLGRMLFSGEDGDKPVSALSGGETARLLMAKLMLQENPVLIFDEPTNHLDLEAVNALGEGLAAFPGTVLLVSHDRDLISDVATRVLAFTSDAMVDFPGTYEEYLDRYPLPEPVSAAKW